MGRRRHQVLCATRAAVPVSLFQRRPKVVDPVIQRVHLFPLARLTRRLLEQIDPVRIEVGLAPHWLVVIPVVLLPKLLLVLLMVVRLLVELGVARGVLLVVLLLRRLIVRQAAIVDVGGDRKCVPHSSSSSSSWKRPPSVLPPERSPPSVEILHELRRRHPVGGPLRRRRGVLFHVRLLLIARVARPDGRLVRRLQPRVVARPLVVEVVGDRILIVRLNGIHVHVRVIVVLVVVLVVLVVRGLLLRQRLDRNQPRGVQSGRPSLDFAPALSRRRRRLRGRPRLDRQRQPAHVFRHVEGGPVCGGHGGEGVRHRRRREAARRRRIRQRTHRLLRGRPDRRLRGDGRRRTRTRPLVRGRVDRLHRQLLRCRVLSRTCHHLEGRRGPVSQRHFPAVFDFVGLTRRLEDVAGVGVVVVATGAAGALPRNGIVALLGAVTLRSDLVVKAHELLALAQ
mmetsp:Transcript_57872/g.122784  ORF Transcript_57872/g.122784 Transcript_57872/m.122784 type:complete len:452 (-) Transcript_57872:236-1591(-)